MELVTLYNYQHMKSKNITANTFSNLTQHGWTQEPRSTPEVRVYKKMFATKEMQYKVMIRFTKTDVYNNIFQLDQPSPFIIVETKEIEENKFRDTKVLHGRKMKNILGYLTNGVSIELFQILTDELKNHLDYKIS